MGAFTAADMGALAVLHDTIAKHLANSEMQFAAAHRTLVRAVAGNRMQLIVDTSKAGFLYGDPTLLPRPMRVAQARRRTVGFCLLFAGPTSFLWWPWWACLGLVVSGCFVMRLAQHLAGFHVRQAALGDPRVMMAAIAGKAIRIAPGSPAPIAPPAGFSGPATAP